MLASKPASAENAPSIGVSDPAIAFSARLIGDDSRVRLVVDFDKSVRYNAYLLDDPKRFIVDLPETIFSLQKNADNVDNTLVGAFRYGAIAPGRSRMLFELLKPVTIQKHSMTITAGEKKHRLIVDLVASDEKSFKTALIEQNVLKKPVENEAGDVSYKGERIRRSGQKTGSPAKHFTIVLDPGHGGIDSGARGIKKTFEKNITLAFANTLKKKIEKNGLFDVILTRDDDVFVRLGERVAIARRNHADLMISIHADSLAQKRIRGATVYTLSDKGSDALSRSLARTQNRSDLIAGLSLPELNSDVTDILIDLTRRETEGFSVRFARMLIERMKTAVKLIRNPHRAADFYVLKAPEVPSILLELGYLSNAEDEELMASGNWREATAGVLAEAIEQFFRPRLVRQ